MVGIVLLAQPPELFPDSATADPGAFYTLLCFLAGSTAAFGFVTMRKLKTVNFLPIALISGCTGIAMTSIPCLFVDVPAHIPPSVLLYLFASGFLSFVELCLLNVGLQIEPVATASVIRLFAPVIGYALALAFLDGREDFWALVGVTILTGTVLSTVLRSTTLKDARAAFLPQELLQQDTDKIALMAADLDEKPDDLEMVPVASYHSLRDDDDDKRPLFR
jgi:drug/metabolite transporter (DMT)-like permease